MASHPPQLIQVKRKRHEDAPVTFLRVEGKNKRRQSGAWLYQRREPDIESAGILHSAPPPPEDLKPVIHVSKPGDELLPLEVLESGRSGKAGARQDAEAQGVAKFARSQKPAGSVAEPRRFHMTRSTGTVAHGGVSKRSRNSAAVFVERGSKRKRVSVGNDREPPDVIIEDTSAVDTEIEPATEVDPKMEVDEPTSRPLKRPGVAKRTAPAAAPAEKQAPRLPASFTNRWDVDMDQLARDMNAYTLEQIGYTLAQQDEEKAREAALTKPASTSPQKSKFKPKAPAKRWAERHPEAALQEKMQDVVTAPADTSMDSETDEDDFVVETYYRVPASALGGAVPPERVGLLVFDTEPDAEFFYGEGSDSEEDWGEDDDDENAEGHYTADYPEDEVESDDEYDRNPYRYRTGNASDLEFDVADGDAGDLAFDSEGPNSEGSGEHEADGHVDPDASRYNDPALKRILFGTK